MKGLIGKKLGMTQIFSDTGESIPVTVVDVTPNVVVQKKTKEKDGYAAIQVGIGARKLTKSNKPMAGHFKKAGDTAFASLRELKIEGVDALELGAKIAAAEVFAEGAIVDITGVSRGKGFQGVMKRYNFSGGRATHGSMFHRAPGSAGASAYPSRVWKGKRYPGHMGDDTVTVQNLSIVKIIADKNLMLIKGAIPGGVNSLVVIKSAKKKSK